MNADELESLIHDIRLILNPIMAKSGQVFYSGRQTLEGNTDFYLMGLNPGGDPCTTDMKMETIEKSLTDWRGTPPEWSEYWDVDWGKKKSDSKEERPGNFPHQKWVRDFCTECLKGNIRKVFSANMIFQRTRDAKDLRELLVDDDFVGRCWQVHKLLFLKVQPKYVICLGNGPNSSFDRLTSKNCLAIVGRPGKKACKMPSGKRHFYIRWFEAAQITNQSPGLERLVRVIGVPHPSRFPLGTDWFVKQWATLRLLDAKPPTDNACE